MNDLPITGYPGYALRTLGSPGGKHASRQKEMYHDSAKLFRRPKKKRFWREINAFSPLFYR